MADESLESKDGTAPAGEFPTGDDAFVEALALFLRTVPVYADGHKRMEAVATRLVDALARLETVRTVEVTRDGIATDECPVDGRTIHAKAVRKALHATAIARVSFRPDTPVASLVAFARALTKNARLAATRHVAFHELWAEPLEGIVLEEELFSEEGFAGTEEGGERGPATAAPGGAGGRGAGGARSSTAKTLAKIAEHHGAGGDTTGRERRKGRDVVFVGRDDAEGPPPIAFRQEWSPDARPIVKRSVSKSLRERIREHEVLGPKLARLEQGWAEREGTRGGVGRIDLLEHVLRALPIEARLDPEKGVRIAARVMDGLDTALADFRGEGDVGDRRAMVLLLDAVRRAFPGRLQGEACPLPEPAAGMTAKIDTAEEEAALLDYLERYLQGVDREFEAVRPAEEPPPLDGESGITALDGLLLHTYLMEAPGVRREQLKDQLVRSLTDRRLKDAACLVRHLKEIALDETRRDLASLSQLAEIAESAGLSDAVGKGGWIPIDLVLATFPRLVGAFILGGGSAGELCRRIGRTDVLAASEALVGPHGPLRGPVVDRLADSLSPDALPLYEVLIAKDDADVRRKLLLGVRKMRLAYPAARALAALPDALITDELFRGVCADAFEGQDSGRVDEAAVTALDAAARATDQKIDARAFAASALGAFDRLIAEPVVRRLLRRRWFVGVEPQDVRRAAKSVLERWAERERAMAMARGDAL